MIAHHWLSTFFNTIFQFVQRFLLHHVRHGVCLSKDKVRVTVCFKLRPENWMLLRGFGRLVQQNLKGTSRLIIRVSPFDFPLAWYSAPLSRQWTDV